METRTKVLFCFNIQYQGFSKINHSYVRFNRIENPEKYSNPAENPDVVNSKCVVRTSIVQCDLFTCND